MMRLSSVILGATLFAQSSAFLNVNNAKGMQRMDTSVKFGIPTFQPKKEEEKSADEEAIPKKSVGLAGVVQLITAGMGAPFLGEFEGVDEESGKFMFSLEANNLVDEDGKSKQTQMPYFESGWVDPEDEKRAQEGFKWPWQN